VGVEPTHKGFADLFPSRITRLVVVSDSAKRANGPESGQVGFAKPTRARRGLAGIGRPDWLTRLWRVPRVPPGNLFIGQRRGPLTRC